MPDFQKNLFLDSHFLNPDRSNLEDIRKLGYAFVDLIVDSVLDTQNQPFVKDESAFDILIPEQGQDLQELMAEVRSQILPRTVNFQNPRYMGHMDSVPSAITIWADALVSAINNNMLSYELAPVFTEMEAQLMQWFGNLFGMGTDCFGTLTAGGSLANISGLLLARNWKQPQSKASGNSSNLVAFVSDAAHTSFEKAMNVIGVGKENLVRVPTNYRGEIILEELESAIQKAIREGKQPFFVAAIAGTTVTGAIDPIQLVGEIAKRYDCWFHIDAAYGGAGIFTPKLKPLFQGCELADSMTFNPQKWLWVARTCAMLIVKNKQHLIDGFDGELPYMDDRTLNFGNLNLQGTRRTDSLKLWMALKAMGISGCRYLVERSLDLSDHLRQWIEDSPELDLVCEPTLNIICLKSNDPQLSSANLRQQWIDAGKLWLSLPLWKGDRILKAVVLHPYAG
ncbi:pyridoxal phosphate-dependent decarboxylase family protein [Pseudanabaena minima]|uniref:pyridoxal phosphate-dependent decarboxylase family protein n=1 Tax=Pseudanabaena minima TaxID=890415 RepID=UPI003DA95701